MSKIKYFNGKFYDLGTSNTSFLNLALDLKKLGVKNWAFMLEIKDYSLAGIDPYKCNKDGSCALTKDEISRIIVECTRNCWYYLREVSRIPDQGNPLGVRYKANRGNIAQAWCIVHGIDSWLCLPRQQGKTQSALALITWAYNFGTSDSTFIFINKDGDNSKENLKRMGDQIDLLPSYMQCERFVNDEGVTEKARKSATRFENPVTNNKVIIKSKAVSKDAALSLARGLTAPLMHFDEPEFTNYIDTIVSNSVSTYETAARNSKKNGTMYARIFTCTPKLVSGRMEGQCPPGKTSLIAGTHPLSLNYQTSVATCDVARGNSQGMVKRLRIGAINATKYLFGDMGSTAIERIA